MSLIQTPSHSTAINFLERPTVLKVDQIKTACNVNVC